MASSSRRASAAGTLARERGEIEPTSAAERANTTRRERNVRLASFRIPSDSTRGGRSAPMPRLIPGPTVIEAQGTPPKLIREFAGRVNTGTSAVSVARMRSPQGWAEPGQRPEFDEFTIVLKG